MVRGRRAALGLLAGGTLVGGLSPRPARAQNAIGKLVEEGPKPLPAITLTDPEGRERDLSSIVGPGAGKGIVLNLWATWCAPCVEEMPALDRLATLLAKEGILVIPASSDRGGRAQVDPFFARTGIQHLGPWLDPRSAATRALGARGLPTTILIDPQGRERARLEGGAAWDSAELVADVRRLCGTPKPGTEPT
ncbi:TlpA family protein disulfide reductase [Roseomonas sp. SG15]|uniref:TlpA family protein disulfide reductase n=1 Tax=Roseomonas indoligenes TaxID=2820811 RepID=A0A940N537_9PROT|nr:TlpA disulfide reductase family protein [Pararoseomonas indoligenes]MBP0494317.1 TlpA family protein disulfide reductase [Pararoseomonas indoligenes]